MKKKILVIDDDPVFVRFLETRLSASGYEVVSATDGFRGYELAKAIRPDLITLDALMPELNGYSVCGFLKTNGPFASIPIIMISSQDVDLARDFIADARPDGFLPKPVSLDQLLVKIEEMTAV